MVSASSSSQLLLWQAAPADQDCLVDSNQHHSSGYSFDLPLAIAADKALQPGHLALSTEHWAGGKAELERSWAGDRAETELLWTGKTAELENTGLGMTTERRRW